MLIQRAWHPPGESLGLKIVSYFPMLRQIQALQFMLPRNAQADEEFRDFKHHDCANDRHSPGDQNTNELIEDLTRVPIQKSQRQSIALRIVEDGIDRREREYTGQ